MSYIENREGDTKFVFVVELGGRPFLAGFGHVLDKGGHVVDLFPPKPLILEEPMDLVNTRGNKVGSIVVRRKS